MFKFNSVSLRWEIGLALAFKVLVLWALWFAVFRHDPAASKPSVAELFTPTQASAELERSP